MFMWKYLFGVIFCTEGSMMIMAMFLCYGSKVKEKKKLGLLFKENIGRG